MPLMTTYICVLIDVDLLPNAMQPRCLVLRVSSFVSSNIFADIVYNAKGHNVVTTIVNGNILMEDRKLNNLDENQILEKISH